MGEYFSNAKEISLYATQELKRLGTSAEVTEQMAIEWMRETNGTKLWGKTLLQVDDELEAIVEQFLGRIIAVTRRNCKTILHKRGSAQLLAGRIYEAWGQLNEEEDERPTVLLDAKLKNNVRGPQVAKAILQFEPGVRVVGFSSVESYREQFRSVGVEEFVLKRKAEPFQSLRQLGELLHTDK